jgi:hypothetical protein
LAGNAEVERKLRAGIDAAKNGDRDGARRLLGEVVRADPRNELAWIWLAAVLTNPTERRAALRRVLDINPANTRARDALRQLDGATPSDQDTALNARLVDARRMDRSSPLADDDTALAPDAARRGTPPAFFLVAGLVLIGLVLVSFALIGGDGGAVVPTATSVADLAPSPTDAPTQTATPLPTRTPLPASMVTRRAPTLPPTFTFTPSPTVTPTPFIVPTLEPARFDLFFVSRDPARTEAGLYFVTGDGLNTGLIADRVRDVSYAPDGFTLAFVREVLGEDGTATASEVFVTTLADPEVVRQVTQLGALDTSRPVWSADGSALIFASRGTGDSSDLWWVALEGGQPRRLTDTPEAEREPALSPDGQTLAFTREDETGFTEIYLATFVPESAELRDIRAATDANGSSYNPSWSFDGRRIAFASDRAGDSDIYLMDAEGFDEQVVTLDGTGADDRMPSLSPDGQWIAYLSDGEDDRFQVYLMPVRGGAATRLTESFRTDEFVRFRPLRDQ